MKIKELGLPVVRNPKGEARDCQSLFEAACVTLGFLPDADVPDLKRLSLSYKKKVCRHFRSSHSYVDGFTRLSRAIRTDSRKK